jgi:hypothetical protein
LRNDLQQYCAPTSFRHHPISSANSTGFVIPGQSQPRTLDRWQVQNLEDLSQATREAQMSL